MHVFVFESGVLGIVTIALLGVKVWAMVDALMRPSEAFPAANKLTKPGWLTILGLSLVAQLVFPAPQQLLSLAGTVAAFVYLLDVRPALASLTRR